MEAETKLMTLFSHTLSQYKDLLFQIIQTCTFLVFQITFILKFLIKCVYVVEEREIKISMNLILVW